MIIRAILTDEETQICSTELRRISDQEIINRMEKVQSRRPGEGVVA